VVALQLLQRLQRGLGVALLRRRVRPGRKIGESTCHPDAHGGVEHQDEHDHARLDELGAPVVACSLFDIGDAERDAGCKQ
jgi:hypothetical protein